MLKIRKTDVVVKRQAVLGGLIAALLGITALVTACNVPPAATPEPTETPTEAPPTSAPQTPANLAASRSDLLEVALLWQDQSDNEDNFMLRRVELDENNEEIDSRQVGQPAEDATSFSDGSVECEARYLYYLSAANTAGVSAEICLYVAMPSDCDDMEQSLTTGSCESIDEPAATPTLAVNPGVPRATHTPTPGLTPTTDVTVTATATEAITATATEAITATATPEEEEDDPVCGNDVCEEGETILTCSQDCELDIIVVPICGDDICNGSETVLSCPADCTLQISP